MELLNSTASQSSYRSSGFSFSDYTFQFRYDFTDTSKMWQDDGTEPADENGDPVYRVDDQSGNGHHLKQTSPLTQPSVTTVADGTGFAVDFPGSDEFMRPDSLSTSADNWVFMAILDNDAASDYVLDCDAGRLVLTADHASGAYYDGNWRGSDINSSALENLVWRLVSPASSVIYRNGVAIESSLAYTQTAIGGNVAVGAHYAATSAHMNAVIRHFWAVKGTMTDAQINEIGNHLNTLHGLSWTDIT